MLLLDTELLSPRDRAEAVQAVVSKASSPNIASFEDPTNILARFELVQVGPGRIFNATGTGNTLLRTPKLARTVTDHVIALAVPLDGCNRFRWAREEQFLGPRDMLLVDLAEPYRYNWEGTSGSYAFQVAADDLDLPMDTVRAAARRLAESELFPLVRDHIIWLTTNAEQLENDPAATDIGRATLQLMRALVASAGREHRVAQDTLEATLLTRVLAYLRQHLTDPTLSPQSVAAAHNISCRYLYKICAQEGISLEQWIIERRLAGAHTDLASPAGEHRTIAEISRLWCFNDPRFFSTRFRNAYGMTPRQWQHATHTTTPAGDARSSA